VANDAQLFFTHCPAPIIGVTGSAGKSTTTALIGHLLRASGLTTWVGGNIGHVLLDDLDGIAVDDVVVMELSSFQLELMSRSPSIAVVTNITPNHLDRHGTMERYIAAKASILAHQGSGDAAVLNRDDAGSRPLACIGKGQRVWFSLREPVASSAYLENDRLMLAGSASPDGNPVAVASIADVPLPGRHNLANALAACAATGLFLRGAGRWPADARALQPALATFRAIPHRLEVVRVLDGVTFVNDSIATSPDRLLAALRSFEAPIVLLLGGADKDIDWTEIVPAIVERARVVIVFGERAPKRVAGKVLPLLEAAGLRPDRLVHRPDVATAFAQARVAARSGDIVLFSPGGTSYDAYTDFEARGAHFRDLVTRL
jgi:UDP-N-acetylmuramoylalanine--D-glutamate ligase